MSCRIIRDEGEGGVSLMPWRPAPGGPEQGLTVPGGGGDGPESGSEQVAELKAALNALASESALKEARARQEGRAEGETAARDQLARPLEEAAARLGARVEELAELRGKLRREAEEDLVRLAVAIARRVLHRELSADPDAILGIVKAALDKLDARELLRVRVHPEDVDVVSAAIRERNVPDRVEVAGDMSLERGGVVLETPRGSLDASVESQLCEIERGFTDLLLRGAR